MSVSKAFKRLASRFTIAASATLAALSAGTVGSHAMDIGTCQAPNVMFRQLAEEGQVFIAKMDRKGINTESERFETKIQYITSTPDFSAWYIVLGNQTTPESSTRMCITLKGTELEINDYIANFDTPPAVSRYEFSRERALTECEAKDKRTDGGVVCNFRDDILSTLKSDQNEQLVLQGNAELQDGSWGGIFSIAADPAHRKEFHMMLTEGTGATIPTGIGEGFQLSDAVLQFLETRRKPSQVSQAPSVDPNPAAMIN